MDRRSLGFPLLLILCIGVPAWVWFQRRDKEPEQIVPDGALKAGEWLAEFELINDLGHPIQMNFPRGRKGTVLFFWHVQCPAVLAVHPRFEALMERYKKRGFEFVVIDSEPLDSLDDVKARRLELKTSYPVLRDNRRKTATRLGVTRAATFLVFDHEATLVYRGAFDDGNKPPKVGYVHQAISALLAETKPGVTDTKSLGCVYTDVGPPAGD